MEQYMPVILLYFLYIIYIYIIYYIYIYIQMEWIVKNVLKENDVFKSMSYSWLTMLLGKHTPDPLLSF